MVIYKIFNTVNGKSYIGQSKNPVKREKTHFYKLNANIHSNPKLQNAWNKYGRNAFRFQIIFVASTQEELDLAEIEFVNILGHYNCKSGGTNGYSISMETRELMRAAKTPKIRSEFSVRMKQYNPMQSQEHRTKVKIARQTQRKPTEDERRRMSERLREVRPSARLTPEQVVEIRELYKTGLSYRELASRYSVGRSTIGRIIRGKTWTFITET